MFIGMCVHILGESGLHVFCFSEVNDLQYVCVEVCMLGWAPRTPPVLLCSFHQATAVLV